MPKNHEPGSLKRGDSVWYRGERFWVEFCPSDWTKGCYARICDEPVHPDASRPLPVERLLLGEKSGTNTFCVHVDMLSVAPVRGGVYADQPSVAAIARAERAKQGVKDVGDPVAVLLRGAQSLKDVYRIGADYLGVAESELRERYGALNHGQQRMNIGNRMRHKWKKEGGL